MPSAAWRWVLRQVFVFPEVTLLEGPNTITARCGELEDTITLNGVAEPNPDYVLPGREDDGEEGVTNWFADIQAEGEMEYPEGYFSLRDNLETIMSNLQAAALLEEYAQAIFGSMAKSMKNMTANMGMAAKLSLQDVLQMTGSSLDDKGRLYLNQQFNKIKK